LAEGQATVPKDAIMIELMSGQATIEAKDYEVLDWEQVQEIKKVRFDCIDRLPADRL
jgi:hypothetical protein